MDMRTERDGCTGGPSIKSTHLVSQRGAFQPECNLSASYLMTEAIVCLELWLALPLKHIQLKTFAQLHYCVSVFQIFVVAGTEPGRTNLVCNGYMRYGQFYRPPSSLIPNVQTCRKN